MNIQDIKAHIVSNNIHNFYIFTGEEIEVQWIYIRQLAKKAEKEIKYVDNITEVFNSLKVAKLITQSFCYVLRDDKELITNEKLWSKIGAVDLPFTELENNILILLLTDVDKRTKFYKHYKDMIVEFKPLSEPLLIKYIKKEIDLSENNCKKLIEICESSYGRILLEIDKIKRYALFAYPEVGHEKENGDYNRALDELVKDGTIYQPPKDAIFDFVDAVLKRQPKRSFQLLQESYDCGEATMVLIQVLYNNVKALLQVQSCTSGNISASTGLSAWQIKLSTNYIGKYTIGELVSFLSDIRQSEMNIKIGEIDESVAIEYILIRNL